ncbi:unnamed protein product, partial [Staurois parvus]
MSCQSAPAKGLIILHFFFVVKIKPTFTLAKSSTLSRRWVC